MQEKELRIEIKLVWRFLACRRFTEGFLSFFVTFRSLFRVAFWGGRGGGNGLFLSCFSYMRKVC